MDCASGGGPEGRGGGPGRGCVLPELATICRLTRKFERLSIHEYYWFLLFAVRNAMEDSGFSGQAIAGKRHFLEGGGALGGVGAL